MDDREKRCALSSAMTGDGQHPQDACGYNSQITAVMEKEFSRLKGITYLDHAGATLYAQSQLDAVFNDLSNNVYGNPHSRHPSSRLTTDAVDQVRYRILHHFNTNGETYDVIFTSGATASLALVSQAFDWRSFAADEGEEQSKAISERTHAVTSFSCPGRFVYLEDNHTSVLGMREVFRKKGVLIKCVAEEEIVHCLRKSESDFVNVGVREGESRPQKQHKTLDDPKNGKLDQTPRKIFSSTVPGLGLFAYPAQSNFCGRKYPLDWIEKIHKGYLDTLFENEECSRKHRWYCVLDAAALVATNILDLDTYKPDFICISFYKMFGYPTGLGALLVKKSIGHLLQKDYFGGGTVLVSLPAENFHVSRPELHERLEDGTIPFLDIIALHHGFEALKRIGGGMEHISRHTFHLGRYVHQRLLELRHGNGRPVVALYSCSGFADIGVQGGIVNFNLLRATGELIGFAEVEKMACVYDIHLRTGCFCNPGACRSHLNLTSDDLLHNFQAGHVCGDENDMVDGRPTGSVRVSFGYMSTIQDAERLLHMIRSCFVQTHVSGTIVDNANPQEDQHAAVSLSKYEQSQLMAGREASYGRPEGRQLMEAICSLEIGNIQHSSVSSSQIPESDCGNPAADKTEAQRQTRDPVEEATAREAISESWRHQAMTNDAQILPLRPPSPTVVPSILPQEATTIGSGDASKPESHEPNMEGEKEGTLQRCPLGVTKTTETILSCRTTPTESQRSPAAENSGLHDSHQTTVLKELCCNCGLYSNAGCYGNHLTNIFVYPVKSCGALEVKSWSLCNRGLSFDREWMIVNSSGISLTQKREPKLCLIKPRIDFNNRKLWLHYEGKPPVSVDLDVEVGNLEQVSVCQSKVCGDSVPAFDCGSDVSEWLSDVLGKLGCRLLRQNPYSVRSCKLKKGNNDAAPSAISLANESQYLLLSRSSVSALLSHIQTSSCDQQDMDMSLNEDKLVHRFRGNLVISGTTPYQEEDWSHLRIGKVVFKTLGSCSRCQMVCIDQDTAMRSKEPLLTLAATRGRKIPFGVHLTGLVEKDSSMTLSVGDPVMIQLPEE